MEPLTILGGGPAGLAAGFFARRAGRRAVILEAGARPGGNAVTLTSGPFRFDAGAHRFHDKDPGVTSVVRALLGDELVSVAAPSAIACDGRFVDFPLSPLSTCRGLGLRRSGRAALDFLRARLNGHGEADDFESFAIGTYGRTIAETFLLGYSEKLWGVPCSTLAREVTAARLRGLTFTTFVIETLLGSTRKAAHLDGAFLYPTLGIGRIVERLADGCGPEAIRLSARVTQLRHDGARIRAVQINGRDELETGDVISTLPIGTLARLLDPPVPAALVRAVQCLTFRHIVLVVFLLAKPSVTTFATVYFPGRDVPFTRVSEPRNRSDAMSPPGHTSLVAEVPCDAEDPLWTQDDRTIIERVQRPLSALGWILDREVVGAEVHRIVNAYPVLRVGTREIVAAAHAHLARFSNLTLSGRAGRFAYSHIHDQIRDARDAVAALHARR